MKKGSLRVLILILLVSSLSLLLIQSVSAQVQTCTAPNHASCPAGQYCRDFGEVDQCASCITPQCTPGEERCVGAQHQRCENVNTGCNSYVITGFTCGQPVDSGFDEATPASGTSSSSSSSSGSPFAFTSGGTATTDSSFGDLEVQQTGPTYNVNLASLFSCESNNRVMKLSGLWGGHGSVYSYSGYERDICFDYQGSGDPHQCAADNSNLILRLTSSPNGHAAAKEQGGSAYPQKICYSGYRNCRTVSESIGCSGGEVAVVKLSGLTNAHIAPGATSRPYGIATQSVCCTPVNGNPVDSNPKLAGEDCDPANNGADCQSGVCAQINGRYICSGKKGDRCGAGLGPSDPCGQVSYTTYTTQDIIPRPLLNIATLFCGTDGTCGGAGAGCDSATVDESATNPSLDNPQCSSLQCNQGSCTNPPGPGNPCSSGQVCSDGTECPPEGRCPTGPPPPLDSDGDGVNDANDNCPTVSNPGQEDSNGDGIGDACEGLDERNLPCDTDDECVADQFCNTNLPADGLAGTCDDRDPFDGPCERDEQCLSGECLENNSPPPERRCRPAAECPAALRDLQDEDGDGYLCDFCPDTEEGEPVDTRGCSVGQTARDGDDGFSTESCRGIGGIPCQSEGACNTGVLAPGTAELFCCLSTPDFTDPVTGQFTAGQESACIEQVYNPTLGSAISITRGRCVDPDGDGQGTKEITVTDANGQGFNFAGTGVTISDIAPECPTTTGSTCFAPCTVLPAGGARQLVPFYTATGALLSLILISSFYFWRRRKQKTI